MGDVLDIMTPLCFVLFFGMVDPWCIFLLLGVLLVQRCANSWKLVKVYQRPFPRCVTSLGVFDWVLHFSGYFMIGCNLLMMHIELDGIGRVVPWTFTKRIKHVDSITPLILYLLL